MTGQGFVESVQSFQVRGWAFDSGDMHAHCEIELKLDGRLLGQTRADVFRDDLFIEGIGAGDHGFVLNLSAALERAQLEQVEVIARTSAGQAWRLPTLSPAAEDPAAATDSGLTAAASPADATQYPVFVLGAARSGTSAVAQALLKSGVYAGHGEGHALGLIGALLTTINTYYRDNGEDAFAGRDTMLARISPDYFRGGVRRMFIEATASLFPSKYWIDKTPNSSMIALAPLFRELWPNAKFIFMRRRGIENVASRLKKFPTVAFEEHCREWAQSMRSWLEIRRELRGAALDVDQLAVARDPAAVSDLIGSFLQLGPDAQRRVGLALKFDLPERTSDRFGKPEALDQMGWSAEAKARFVEICSEALDRVGYTLDAAYVRDPATLMQTV